MESALKLFFAKCMSRHSRPAVRQVRTREQAQQLRAENEAGYGDDVVDADYKEV